MKQLPHYQFREDLPVRGLVTTLWMRLSGSMGCFNQLLSLWSIENSPVWFMWTLGQITKNDLDQLYIFWISIGEPNLWQYQKEKILYSMNRLKFTS